MLPIAYQDGRAVVGADMPLDSARYPIKELLETFRDIVRVREDAHLVLSGRRIANESFSVWNYVDENGLTDRVTYLPYYQRCTKFPLKKDDCWTWIGRDIAPDALNAENVFAHGDQFSPDRNRYALFVTSFHIERQEGNTRNMRHWLAYLRAAGYRVHVLYYATDTELVSDQMRERAAAQADLYKEVPLQTKLWGVNTDGLNVHVDDWCGKELLDAASELVSKYEYNVAVVNYPFISGVFDVIPNYTKKILFTHDSFTDRNRRMLEQGYSSASWVSLDRSGEKKACDRSDIIVALQDQEAEFFAELVGDRNKIRVVCPVFPSTPVTPAVGGARKLRIGYFGSSNWVNEQNLALYLRAWLELPALAAESEVIVAGGVCDEFIHRAEGGEALLAKAAPKMMGRVADVSDFFKCCDVVINPERGGTGIKIKTLEAMAASMPVITTTAGCAGIGSDSRFHAATDIQGLARLTAEVAGNRSLLQLVSRDTAEAYQRYVIKNQSTMDELFGRGANSVSRVQASQKSAFSAPVARSNMKDLGLSVARIERMHGELGNSNSSKVIGFISEIAAWANRASEAALTLDEARAVEVAVQTLRVAARDTVRKLESKGQSPVPIMSLDGSEALGIWVMSPDAPWLKVGHALDSLPAMITDEEKQYYNWLGKFYKGHGRIVELGPWLGASTVNILSGLENNPKFRSERLHVFDDFVWRKDWMDNYVEPSDRLPRHADFRHLFERNVKKYEEKLEITKSRFAVYDGNDAVPLLSWDKGPIEMIYVDCGRTMEANEGWWAKLSPYFIPGETIIVMQDWRVHREVPELFWNQTDLFTASKGPRLRQVHEMTDGAAATFVYH